ncbi:MAG TPA: FGGY-family carbohydrate kinase [Candidatus Acidoferrales bacterium]|nr:FGGY-family carbohydrate kinase [Candidatus Acidoferrales bacterium]
MHILSIDLGTSGPKVALVSETGDIVASAAGAVQTRVVPQGGAEQDAEEIWSSVVGAMKQVIAEAAVAAEQIAAITCSSQYFSVVPVDRELRPVMDLILWMDSRGARHTQELYGTHPSAFETWIEICGMMPLPTGNDSLSHMLYVRHERPEVYERTFKFLEPVDFLLARLTGVCTSNLCTAFPLLLTDNRDLTTLDYDTELLRMAGIDREKLADLLPIGAEAGRLHPEVAAELGLSPKTRVFSGTNDTQAAAVGTATFRAGAGAINVGTTSQVLAHVGGKKSDLANALLSMPSPIAGRYMVMAENGLGGKPLDHFLRNVVFADDALGRHSTTAPFAAVEAVVAAAPAGSNGLLYFPWLTGAQCPESSPATRGGFLNITLGTTRAHMVRAILEGVAFNMRWVLPAVESFCDTRFDELLFCGGAAVSDAWSQILADIVDRPVGQLAEPRYVNNRGTAFLGFVAMGVLGLDDIDRLCRVHRRYEPRAATRQTYDELFAQFLAAFAQTRPVFEALNQ